MWPFDMIPRDRVLKEHGVTLTDAWLDHVRLASVRFNNGGSGSFVSATGLVLTNHHVAADCIGKVASSSSDLMANGFRAGTDGPELKCPDLELNVTVAIQDVTDEVRAAKTAGMSDADANTAIKGAMSTIEKRCHDASGKRCDVVTLYAGGKYELTTYEKYTDVRLVFAPERTIAFFGGDPENFTYPRFDYDLAIFRVYGADGAHLVPTSYLAWNEAGPKDGDTVFVSGHPGSTGRLETMAELASDRDTLLPFRLAWSHDLAAALVAYGGNGAEEKREAGPELFHVRNTEKALTGFESGLKDPALMKKKGADEALLRQKIDADPKLKGDYGQVFGDIAALQKKVSALYPRYVLLDWADEGRYQPSSLLKIARELVRLPAELALANDKRLRDYRDTNLDSLKLHLLSGAPVYGGVEAALVRVWLEHLVKALGAKDPALVAVLAGRTPARAAQEMVAESKLFDVYARKALLDGGSDAVARSTDPMIVARCAPSTRRRARRGSVGTTRSKGRAGSSGRRSRKPRSRWWERASRRTRRSRSASPSASPRGTPTSPGPPPSAARSPTRPGRSRSSSPSAGSTPRGRSIPRRRSTSSPPTTSSAATAGARWWARTGPSWASSSTATSPASPTATFTRRPRPAR